MILFSIMLALISILVLLISLIFELFHHTTSILLFFILLYLLSNSKVFKNSICFYLKAIMLNISVSMIIMSVDFIHLLDYLMQDFIVGLFLVTCEWAQMILQNNSIPYLIVNFVSQNNLYQ